LQERVGGALSGVEVVLLVRECREPKTGQFGVIFNGKVVDDFTLFVKDGDQAVLANLVEVVAGDVQLLLSVHGEGSGSKASRELMEDTGVENSGSVNDDSQDTVLERFGNVKNALFGVHGETSGVGKASIDDGLKHADTEVDHE